MNDEKVANIIAERIENKLKDVKTSYIENAVEQATYNVLKKIGLDAEKDYIEIQQDLAFMRRLRIFIERVISNSIVWILRITFIGSIVYYISKILGGDKN